MEMYTLEDANREIRRLENTIREMRASLINGKDRLGNARELAEYAEQVFSAFKPEALRDLGLDILLEKTRDYLHSQFQEDN